MRFTGDIARRENVSLANNAHVVVDFKIALSIQRNARGLQAQVINTGATPGCEQNLFALDRLGSSGVLHFQFKEIISAAPDPNNLARGEHPHAFAVIDHCQTLSELLWVTR